MVSNAEFFLVSYCRENKNYAIIRNNNTKISNAEIVLFFVLLQTHLSLSVFFIKTYILR